MNLKTDEMQTRTFWVSFVLPDEDNMRQWDVSSIEHINASGDLDNAGW
jgi:S-ribosylhomocysteine lyase LuxS involved in autoinducer biosynthesis